MMPDPTTLCSFTVRDHTTRVHTLTSFRVDNEPPPLVSGHAFQIDDLNGDEPDGFDECGFLFLFN